MKTHAKRKIEREETARRWKDEYLSGKSSVKIAEEEFVTPSYVRRLLKSVGTPMRRRGDQGWVR